MINCKSIYTLLACLFCTGLLLSCGKDPAGMELSDAPLVFRTGDNWGDMSGNGAPTKAGFAVGATMGVYADYNTGAPDVIQEYMSNQLVEMTDDGWIYDPVKYWPENGSLSFYAYAPHKTGAVESEAGASLVPFRFGGDDVAWARRINGQAPGAPMTASGSVSMDFTHKLSQLRFRFNLSDEHDRGEGYHVTGLAIQGDFPWAAYMNVRTGLWEYENTDKYYTAPGENRYSTLVYGGNFPIDADESTEAVVYMMADGMKDFSLVLTTDYGRSIMVSLNMDEPLEEGRSYVVNLNFNTITAIGSVTLEIADWIEVVPESTVIGQDNYIFLIGKWLVDAWNAHVGLEEIGYDLSQSLHAQWMVEAWMTYTGGETIGYDLGRYIVGKWTADAWTVHNKGETIGADNSGSVSGDWTVWAWQECNDDEIIGEDNGGGISGDLTAGDWTDCDNEGAVGSDDTSEGGSDLTVGDWTECDDSLVMEDEGATPEEGDSTES